VSADVRDWLPIGAAAGELVRSTVTRAIVQWSERWFASGGLGVGSVSAVCGGERAGDEGDDWRIYQTRVAIRYSPSMASRLLDRALGMRLEGLPFTESDRRVLSSFTQRLIEDLAVSVEIELGVKGEPQEQPRFTADPLHPLGGAIVRFSDGRDQLLALAIPLDVIATLYKSELPKSGAKRDDLTSLSVALRPEDIVLEATIGHARMSVLDLRGLEPGDVIVLDTCIDRGGEIALASGGLPFARVGVGEDGGRLALELQTLS
jgi:hypothetical protein